MDLQYLVMQLQRILLQFYHQGKFVFFVVVSRHIVVCDVVLKLAQGIAKINICKHRWLVMLVDNRICVFFIVQTNLCKIESFINEIFIA